MSELAVRRRVTVLMGVIVFLVLGALSYLHLPVDLLPDPGGLPSAGIVVSYPSATAAQVEAEVSRPLEQAVASLPGVRRVHSTSQPELAVVNVGFARGTSTELALLELRDQVEQLRRSLPPGSEPPLVIRYDPTLIPVMSVGITGFVDAARVRELVDTAVRERLEGLPGVAAVVVTGGSVLEVAIDVDPAAVAAAGISWTQLRVALSSLAINLPAGHVVEMGREVAVRSIDRPEQLADIRNLVVGLRYVEGGAEAYPVPIRLSELASVDIKEAPGRTSATVNGRESVILHVHRAAHATAADVVELVTAELPGLRPLLPPGLTFDVTLNRAEFAGQSTRQVVYAGLLAAAVALVLLLLSLLSIGAAMIAATTVVMAVAGTLALMYALGLSLNLMTLGGLSVVVGLLAVNAVLVLNDIRRGLVNGETPSSAAVAGVQSAFAAAVAGTLVAVAALAPVAFVPGANGSLFREFALAAGFALLITLPVAVTFVPAAAAALLRSSGANGNGVQGNGQPLGRAYGSLLAWAVNNRWQVVLLLPLCLTLTYQAAVRTGGEFAPRLDRGEFMVTVQMPPGTSFERTDQVVREIASLAGAIPEARYVTSATGSAGSLALGAGAEAAAADMGTITVKLSEAEERARSTGEVMAELEGRLWVPGVRVALDELASHAFASVAPFEISVRGPAPGELHRLADELRRELSGIRGLGDIHVSGPSPRPEIQVQYDRSELAVLGLTPLEVAVQVRGALSGDVVGSFAQDERAGVDVVLRYAGPAAGSALERVRGIRVVTPLGTTVRLAELARITRVLEPASIERLDGQRVLTLVAHAPGPDLASVLRDVRASIARVGLPDGYSVALGGEGREMEAAFADLARGALVAIALIYVILAAHFESLIHPFAILAGLPLGALGAAGAMYFSKTAFSVSSVAGGVILTGLVVNTGVILVDRIGYLRRRGLQREVAVSVAGRDRLGVIAATCLVSAGALVPLAFLPGQGLALLRPLALVLFGGLAVAAPLSLVVVPAVYLILDDLATVRRRARRSETLEASELL